MLENMKKCKLQYQDFYLYCDSFKIFRRDKVSHSNFNFNAENVISFTFYPLWVL